VACARCLMALRAGSRCRPRICIKVFAFRCPWTSQLLFSTPTPVTGDSGGQQTTQSGLSAYQTIDGASQRRSGRSTDKAVERYGGVDVGGGPWGGDTHAYHNPWSASYPTGAAGGAEQLLTLASCEGRVVRTHLKFLGFRPFTVGIGCEFN
jgi:hypothetical protein